MAKLLYGKPVAEAMCEKLRARAEALRAKGVAPKLAIIRVGENPSDLSYERGAIQRAAMAGAEVQIIALPEDSEKADVLNAIRETGLLSAETEAEMKKALESYTADFLKRKQ